MGSADEYRGHMEDGDESAVRAGEAFVEGRARKRAEARTDAGAVRRAADDAAGGDERLRRRLAEALSAAGVGANRVAIEVLYLLPNDFVRAYTDLFHRALNTTEDGMGRRNDSKADLGRAQGSGARRGKGSRGVFLVRDDKAMGEKERIDRQLRKLARSMRDGGAAGVETVAKCGEKLEQAGCGRWVENGWKYCSNCGKKQTK